MNKIEILQKEAREKFRDSKAWTDIRIPQGDVIIDPKEHGKFLDDLITHIYTQAIEDVKEKGTLVENPIDQGPDAPPVDGSYYQIYAGDLEALTKTT